VLDRYHYMWSELYNMNVVILGFAKYNHRFRESEFICKFVTRLSSSLLQKWTLYGSTAGSRAPWRTTARIQWIKKSRNTKS